MLKKNVRMRENTGRLYEIWVSGQVNLVGENPRRFLTFTKSVKGYYLRCAYCTKVVANLSEKDLLELCRAYQTDMPVLHELRKEQFLVELGVVEKEPPPTNRGVTSLGSVAK